MRELSSSLRSLLFAAVFVLMSACGTSDGPEEYQCDPSETLCGDICVDTNADLENCGGCGIACGAGEICSDGQCALVCPDGLEVCDGACVDTRADLAHCGGCNLPCDGLCEEGVCVLDCPEGQTACGGSCVDLSSDGAHCGACQNACGDAAVCEDSDCVCAPGATRCDGACVFVESDVDHCGGCGNACEPGPNATGVSCEESTCVPTCSEGFASCDGDPATGCEADLGSIETCGACGVSCRADQVCTDGACTCPEGQTLCGGLCVDTDADVHNCGECGVTCEGRTNATAGVCEEGACVLTCMEPFADCNGELEDGCETGTHNSEEHCGACGVTCRDDQTCFLGACTCPDGLTDCDGACVDTLTDSQHCDGCGNECAGVCTEGVCCAPGLAGCGFECVDFDSNPDHCGGCGISCADFPNAASGICQASVCTSITCEPGFDDCNLDMSDGCEIDLMTDANNCGSCGTPACVIGCAGGACAEVVAFSARNDHGCVILSGDGSVKCWGSNRDGQIGNGTLGTGVRSLVPEYVQDPTDPTGRLTGATQIVTGFGHSCVVTASGGVKCWGSAMDATGGTIYNPLPVDVADPDDPSGLLSGVTQLASGRNFLCALMQDTTIKCWGFMPDGMGGTQSVPLPMTMLASINPPTPIQGVSQIALGNFHACGLALDGSVLCLGNNSYGELGDGTNDPTPFPVVVGGATPLTNVSQLSLAQDSTCALHTDGTVSCWGRNNQDQLGVTGADSNLPVQVTGLSNVTQLSAGMVSHVCARLGDGTARCWGNGGNRRLGNGVTGRSLPTPFMDGANNSQPLSGIEQIEAGNAHTCAWLTSGEIHCVGRNNNGQLGDGTTSSADWATPVTW